MAGQTLIITNSATDADIPVQILAFSQLSTLPCASITTNSGVFTWRPAIAQSPSTQTVSLAVSDSGLPTLSATQSFVVTVIKPSPPSLGSISITNGQAAFWVGGDVGPDYTAVPQF